MLLLPRSYYIEHPIELSNLLNASFQNVMNEFFFCLYSHRSHDRRVRRGSVPEEVEPDTAVTKPQDNFKMIFISNGDVT